jgi:hypothetical protein
MLPTATFSSLGSSVSDILGPAAPAATPILDAARNAVGKPNGIWGLTDEASYRYLADCFAGFVTNFRRALLKS